MSTTTYSALPHESEDGLEDALLPVPNTTPQSESASKLKWRRIMNYGLLAVLIMAVITVTSRSFLFRGPIHWSPHRIHHNHHPQVVQVHPEADRNPAYLIKAKHGAVASENIRCSRIGVDVMKDGGNAVDAMVASIFCTGVVNMFSYAPSYI